MVFGKGLRPFQVAGVIVLVKILSVFLVQTWYVPDEYWQTLEVAHKQVFKYGELTWEWKAGIRSYLYPSIVAALYSGLKLTGLDYPEALIILPRIFQALLSALADYSFYKWTGYRKWALLLMLTSWFWFYTSSRTLLQTFETCLVTIALSYYPFKGAILSQYEKESNLWIALACVSVFVRPTSAPLWVVLGVYNIMTTNQPRLKLVTQRYIPIGIIVAALSIGLDSYFHGSIIVTPWEFFRHNILQNVSSFYGQHPWYWYITQGVPAVLGINLVPVVIAFYTILRRPSENRVGVLLLAIIGLHLALYSYVPHKEFRFLLPILPIFLYLAQDVIVRWSRKAKNWQLYIVASLLLVGNAVPALYFGVVHQSGTLSVMPLIRESVSEGKTSVAFLMPCHSTPLYSHIHANITTRYLNCEPTAGQTYESEYFFTNPLRWWKNEYSNKPSPHLLVMFDTLKGRMENVLGGYKLKAQVAHTQFPEKEVGENVLLYEKQPRTEKTV